MLRIGIDTGGTFTDFVLFDGEQLKVFKVPSTRQEPEAAVLKGLERILSGKKNFLVQHGSTVATNAFLERKGARCVLVTNQGFEDLIEIGRQSRPGLYSLSASKPEPLVLQKNRIGVKERTLWDGQSLVALEKKSIDWVKSKAAQLKPESIAVVLLYSYLASQNEVRIGEALESIGVPISLSHRILPEFREYERTSTTVINAYVQPIMSRYLTGLCENPVMQKGRFTIMQSNGGSISAETAKNEPIRTLFSGPAGGVVGAFETARQAGFEKIITLDMGGTSTDVCLCNGKIETTNEASLDHYPVSVQMIGIHSIGAGGGSIAWVDKGGLLKVGPQSAGADPGPICYGSGTEVTVTDANVILGRLDPDFFLGGEIKLHPGRIQPALKKLGKQMRGSDKQNLEPEEIAEGIIKITNSQMERAIRVISLQKGFDTRYFTLVTFGGAGGFHACDLARSLMIPRVLVPLNPGTLSATGILRSDVVRDASQTVVMTSDQDKYFEDLETKFRTLRDQVTQEITQQGFSEKEIRFESTVDARYLGQSYEINTPFSPAIVRDFHRLHDRQYGYANPALPVEMVNARVRGYAGFPIPALKRLPLEPENPQPEALLQEKQVILDRKPTKVRFFLRDKLAPGNRIEGPAIVLEYSSTTLIPPDFSARIDELLNILIEPKEN
jgi:N-methylhydantoinase A